MDNYLTKDTFFLGKALFHLAIKSLNDFFTEAIVALAVARFAAAVTVAESEAAFSVARADFSASN
jgi:hypothetical protein